METDTGLTTGLTAADVGKWHNYAVQFDLTQRTLDFYVNEVYRGSVDLDDITENDLNVFPLSNAYVNVGHHLGGPASSYPGPCYMDNVQVGIPEPGTLILLGSGLLFLLWRRRT